VSAPRRLLVCRQCRDPAGGDGEAKSGVPRALRAAIAERGLGAAVEVVLVDCYTQCGWGVNLRVEPDGVWYGAVTAADAGLLIDQHICGGQPVAHLRVPVEPLPDDG
jgi:(2Fe-2S) ferredoxin